METKNREKLLLIVTGAFAALYLLNLLLFSPLIDSWHSRSNEIVALKKQIADGRTLLQRESVIRDRWNTMQANALPNNPTVAQRQMLTSFDHWVKSSGVAEGSFRPSPQEGDTNYSTVECRSDVSGGPSSVRDFLRAMTRDPLANKVDSFDVTSKDENGQQLSLGLSTSGLILTGSDPTSVTPTAEPKPPAPDEGTNLVASSESDAFHLIELNNIFDQNRVYSSGYHPPQNNIRPRVHEYKTLTASATGISNGVAGSAYFEGSDVRYPKFYDEGSTVGGFKIVKVMRKTVTLEDASSNIFVLPADGSASLRSEDNGPWHESGYTAGMPYSSSSSSSSDTNSTASNSTAPASGGTADDVLARLKKQREDAEK